MTLLLGPILGAALVALAVSRMVERWTSEPRMTFALAVDAAPLALTAVLLAA